MKSKWSVLTRMLRQLRYRLTGRDHTASGPDDGVPPGPSGSAERGPGGTAPVLALAQQREQDREKARTRAQIRETRARVQRVTDLREIRQRKGAE